MKLSFPPVITLVCILVQVLLYNLIPLTVNLSILMGLFLLFPSIGVIFLAFKELNKHETTIYPDGEPEHLVTTGPFKYSRNPIYLGMFGIILSVAFLMQSLSALLKASSKNFQSSLLFKFLSIILITENILSDESGFLRSDLILLRN